MSCGTEPNSASLGHSNALKNNNTVRITLVVEGESETGA